MKYIVVIIPIIVVIIITVIYLLRRKNKASSSSSSSGTGPSPKSGPKPDPGNILGGWNSNCSNGTKYGDDFVSVGNVISPTDDYKKINTYVPGYFTGDSNYLCGGFSKYDFNKGPTVYKGPAFPNEIPTDSNIFVTIGGENVYQQVDKNKLKDNLNVISKHCGSGKMVLYMILKDG